MASQNDVNNARQEGYESGRQEALRQLRAFTGTGDLSPDLDEPEHRAYPEYLMRLTEAQQVAVDRAEQAQELIHRLSEQLAAAEIDEQQTLAKRREERADKNLVTWLTSRAGDGALPVAKELRTLRKKLAHQQNLREKFLNAAHRHETEANKVARWVDGCIADMDGLQAMWAERAEAERVEDERERRDTTPRWCHVFRHEDFTGADTRRCGAITFDDGLQDVGGADFGYDWRRDVHGGEERWALHHILETNETILRQDPQSPGSAIWLLGDAITSLDEAMDVFDSIEPRQGERNSIALVLDAYEQHRALLTQTGA